MESPMELHPDDVRELRRLAAALERLADRMDPAVPKPRPVLAHRILAYVERHPLVTRAMLTGDLRTDGSERLRARDVWAVVETLVSAGKLRIVQEETAGRPRTFVRLPS
jgi:hypothetical protein